MAKIVAGEALMRAAYLCFSIVSLLLLGWCIMQCPQLTHPVQGFAQESLEGLKNWQPVIDFTSNAFFQWRFDSWLVNMAIPFGRMLTNHLQALFLIQCLLLSLGLVLLVKQMSAQHSWSACIFEPTLIVLSLLVVFGRDLVIFGALLWVPWVLWSALRIQFQGKPQLFDYLLLFFFSLRLAASANQLALLLGVLAILCFNFVGQRSYKHWLIVLLVCLPGLLTLALAPAPSFPAYPWLGRVVPDDNLPGVVRPLIGSEPPLPVIDRGELRNGYGLLAWFVLAAALAIGIAKRSARSLFFRRSILAALGLALFADLVLPESFSQIGPLASLSRIVPGLFHHALSPIVGGFSILYGLLVCSNLERKLLSSAIALLFCSFGVWQGEGGLRFGAATGLAADNVFAEFNRLSEPSDAQRQSLFSPSYSILKARGLSVLDLKARAEQSVLKSAKEFQLQLRSSHKQRGLSRAMDGKLNTRWSPKSGAQQGGEWLDISFAIPQVLRGVSLDPGNFPTDFPRGLKFSYSEECNNNSSKLHPLLHFPDWQGSLHFTTQGAPYYGSQAEVTIVFPTDTRLCRLLIEQSGHSVNFDWSVAELEFLLPLQAN